MFHFKKMTIITTCLFIVSIVLIFLAKVSPIIVNFALVFLSASFGCLTYILIDEYNVYKQILQETKYELLMELAITENAQEYISNPDFYNKKDLKRIKAQKRSKKYIIALSIFMCIIFITLLILRIILNK